MKNKYYGAAQFGRALVVECTHLSELKHLSPLKCVLSTTNLMTDYIIRHHNLYLIKRVDAFDLQFSRQTLFCLTFLIQSRGGR